MDESLRWLAANGKKNRVLKVLKKACRWNNRKLQVVLAAFYRNDEKSNSDDCEIDEQEETNLVQNARPHKQRDITNADSLPMLEGETKGDNLEEKLESPGSDYEGEKLNFTDLIRHRVLRVNIFFCILAWCVNSLTYYALLLMSSTLSGDLYTSFSIGCLVEIPQSIYCLFFLDKVGRKWSFALFSGLAGVTLFASGIFRFVQPDSLVVVTILTFIGKLGISGSFNVLYTYTPEVFPTNIRNTAVGLSSMGARVGGLLAPFASLLMKKVVYAPGIIFGSGCILLSGLVYFLPETSRHELPQTTADMEMWFKPVTKKPVGNTQTDGEDNRKQDEV